MIALRKLAAPRAVLAAPRAVLAAPRAVLAAPRAVLAGALLVLVANAAILATAAWNRAGAPRSTLTMTERELALPSYRLEDNSEIFLGLTLGHDPPAAAREAARRMRRPFLRGEACAWLDRDKLRALGFDREFEPARPGEHHDGPAGMTRRAFIAVEYEGPAWEQWLARAEQRVARLQSAAERGGGDEERLADARALLAIDRVQRSRLFAVDADLDPSALERRVAGRARIAILEGLVLAVEVDDEGAPPVVRGRILELLPAEVHVPPALAGPLAPFVRTSRPEPRDSEQDAWPEPVPARYAATIAVGRAYEPWLVELRPGPKAP